MSLKPSPTFIQTLAEMEIDTVIGSRIKQLEQDFILSIEELPIYKARMQGTPESAKQGLIDLAFSFFIAGCANALDPSSNFNTEKASFEFREDLN